MVHWATQLVVDALRAAGGIARFEEVLAVLRRRAPPHQQPSEGLVRFLRRLDERVVRVTTGRGEVWALRDQPVGAVPGIQALGISVLRKARAGLSLDALTDKLMERLPSPRPDRSFVAGAVRVCSGVTVSEEGLCFYGRPRHKLTRLVELLREAGKPLHVRAIKDGINQTMKEQSTSHAVHEFLIRESE